MSQSPPPPITHRAPRREIEAPAEAGRAIVAAVRDTGIPSFTVHAPDGIHRITVTKISNAVIPRPSDYPRAGMGRP